MTHDMTHKGKLVVAGLMGGEMESFVQIAEVVLLGLVDDRELKSWRLHTDIIDLLRLDAPTEADLNELHTLTMEWKSLMVSLYGDVVQRPSFRRRGSKRRKHGHM